MAVTVRIPEFDILRPVSRYGPLARIRFHNKREIWQGQRAAKRLNISFNSYVRMLVVEHSARVLTNTKRKGR